MAAIRRSRGLCSLDHDAFGSHPSELMNERVCRKERALFEAWPPGVLEEDPVARLP
jgi:hypothetical protein